jgi:ABC-type Fe3+-hydroxamate transport system substrate-binding protein
VRWLIDGEHRTMSPGLGAHRRPLAPNFAMKLRTLLPLAALTALGVAVVVVRMAATERPADAPRSNGAKSSAETRSAPHDDGYPREVVIGDVVLRLDARPTRMLPCNASAVDYLVSLVEPTRVLGLPHTALAYATLDGPYPGWEALPSLHDYSSEAMLGLAPDLVLTHAWQDKAAMTTLETAGVPVLRLPETHSYEDLRRLIEALGRAFDVEPRSRALLDEYDARVAALAADRSRSGWSALSYSNYGTGGWTAGAGTTADLVIGLAGMKNAAGLAGLDGHVGLEMERLLVIDPDVLVLGMAAVDDGSSPTLDLVSSEPALAGLAAVRARRFAVLPTHLALADSHRLVDAAEALARAVDKLRAGAPDGAGGR